MAAMPKKRVTCKVLMSVPVNWSADDVKRIIKTALELGDRAERDVHVRVEQEDTPS